MAGIIDTNVLLYAANRNAEEHRAAAAFLNNAAASASTWYLTDGIVYEFLRVATHAKVFDRPLSAKEAFGFLDAFLSSDRFVVLATGERHWRLLEAELKSLTRPSGNLFFDIRTVVLMREYGIREIYTTDTDFLQFKDLSVINPLAVST